MIWPTSLSKHLSSLQSYFINNHKVSEQLKPENIWLLHILIKFSWMAILGKFLSTVRQVSIPLTVPKSKYQT